MANQPKLRSLDDLFTNPTPINIDLDKIRRLHDLLDIDESALRAGEDWSFLSDQVVGAENPQGDYRGR
jgi:hypothetical protein